MSTDIPSFVAECVAVTPTSPTVPFSTLRSGQRFSYCGRSYARLGSIWMGPSNLAMDGEGRVHAVGPTDLVTIEGPAPCST